MKKNLRLILPLAILCFVVISCNMEDEKTTNSGVAGNNTTVETTRSNTAATAGEKYEKDGISFTLPKDWNVSEDQLIEGTTRNINVEGPNNEVLIITTLPANSDADLKYFVDNFKDNFSKSVDVGKVSEIKTEEIARSINGAQNKGSRNKYSLSEMGQSVPHTTDFFIVKGKKNKAVLTIQSPDEDLANADNSFGLIADSLKFE